VFFLFILLSCGSTLAQVDSVKQAVNQRWDSLSNPSAIDSIKTITDTYQNKADSVSRLAELNKVDSLTRHTQSKIDSLTAINKPIEKYQKKLDSLANKYPNQVNETLENYKSKITSKADSIKNNLTRRLTGGDERLEKLSDKMPDESLDDLTDQVKDTEELDTELTDVEGLNTEKLEEASELTDKIENNAVSEEISEISNEAQSIAEKPKDEIESLKSADEVQNVKDQIDEVSEVGEEVNAVSEEVDKIKEGDLSGTEEKIEEKIVVETDISKVDEEAAAFEEVKEKLESQKDQIEQYQNQDLVKQRIMEKSKYVANDVLAEYKDKVAKARSDLLDYKPDSILVGDSLVKARPHALRNKSLKSRLLPGVTIEIGKQEATFFDLLPFMAFQINTKMNVMAGYLVRINVNKKSPSIDNTNIYGPRIAFNYYVYKGFYLKGTMEMLRVPVASVNDELTRDWVTGVFLGIGKDYRIAGILNGDIHAMYNLNYDSNTSPYENRFNIRFGFFLNSLKASKKPSWKEKWRELKKRR